MTHIYSFLYKKNNPNYKNYDSALNFLTILSSLSQSALTLTHNFKLIFVSSIFSKSKW